MTLKKIITIKNTGCFLNLTASGDVTFKSGNLIFAENGRGKTTLCAILRSLQSGEPAYILGRKTLGCTENPEIEILTQAGNAEFVNGKWNSKLPKLTVFDEFYVSENVYAGCAVDTEQRRNLYHVIIGEQGVSIANELRLIDTQLRRKTEEITATRGVLSSHIPSSMSMDEFLEITQNDAVDQVIAEKQREINAIGRAEQIAQRSSLKLVALPEVPRKISETLAKTIRGIATDAEQRIEDHIHSHKMEENGKPWLTQGINYIENQNCPFCGQSLEGITLIDAYKSYFDEAYDDLKKSIDNLTTDFNSLFGDADIAKVVRVFEENKYAFEFWKDYCSIEAPNPISESDISSVFNSLLSSAVFLLNRKSAAPLEKINTDEKFAQANSDFKELTLSVIEYNETVNSINSLIEVTKKKIDTGNAKLVNEQLDRLNAQKVRFTTKVNNYCEKFQRLLCEKIEFERNKESTKHKLDQHSRNVIEQYGDIINQYLDKFNAGFRISTPNYNYKGRTPSTSYEILINNTAVELGRPDTPLSVPSFKNTLSSGDRSTLALAFFFAQLKQNPDLSLLTVVIDDPFTSQDAFRRNQTAMEIRRFVNCCSQLLLLSHDPHFLKLVWNHLSRDERKALQFIRVGETNTTMSEIDIDEVVKSRYLSDIEALQYFFNDGNGDPRNVVQKIRPVLEGYCRSVCLNLFENDTLGEIIIKIKCNGNNHRLFIIVDDLEDLNEFSKRFHHSDILNPAKEEPINNTELAGYVKRTLKIVGNLI